MACTQRGWPGVDLLIIGGDFQSVRNAHDLKCVSMPAKYREMHDFHEYYSGHRTAPCLTIFVGGNHEASNYLFELYYGGWVAPNIYYMGAANVIRVGPLRIAGMSGIWKGYNYKKPHHERLPYNEDDIKSVYHVRELDVRKLLQIRTQVDVGISHDWPRGVEWRGDYKKLFRQKSFFEEDARNGQLGSVAAKYVLDRLRPPFWFSAHLHCKFAAVIDHGVDVRPLSPQTSANDIPLRQSSGQRGKAASEGAQLTKNSAEIDLDMDASDLPAAESRNADEIDLDIDEEDQPAAANSIVLAANADEIDLELEEDESEDALATVAPGQGLDGAKIKTNAEAALEEPRSIADDVRAQLPAAFNRPKPAPSAAVEPMSHPAAIMNKSTNFLALDKCMPNRDFLQVLSIPAVSDLDVSPARPLQLEYDKEWLAITRVFAQDLVVGQPHAHIPTDQGEAHYKSLIESEEAWIEENLVGPGQMAVPLNFETTAPLYDPLAGIHVQGGPQEYTNNQTTKFCEMLQIPNPFDMNEGQRAERMREGPREEEPRRDGGFRGGPGGASRGGGFGRGRGRSGGRGRGGGGRGQGRGRGRGGQG